MSRFYGGPEHFGEGPGQAVANLYPLFRFMRFGATMTMGGLQLNISMGQFLFCFVLQPLLATLCTQHLEEMEEMPTKMSVSQ